MNRNKKVSKIKRTASFSLAAAMAIVSLCGCSDTESQGTDAAAGLNINDNVTYAVNSHGGEDGKEETVYVIAGADGSVMKTIVSAWLKNPSEADEITDYSVLEGIENIKGDEPFSYDDAGNLIWKADGADIYYQGKTDKELPVSVKITYELDGKEISAQELAGKSGHLKMTFTYTNNAGKEVEIDGKKTTIYQPFGIVSAAMFDNDKVSNIIVENGKAINDGEHTIVCGIALPGLSESLGLSDLEVNGEKVDIDIPESITISCDVTDFSLMATITLADNNLLKGVSEDENGDFTLDSLISSMDDMMDAAAQLVDGTDELYGGISELDSGVSELAAGAGQLNEGAGELMSGMESLNDGACQLRDGISELSDKAPSLINGISKASDGAALLDTGASQVSQGAGQLDDGVVSLSAGLCQINDGAQALDNGLAVLLENVSALPQGTASLLSGMEQIKAALKSGSPENPGIYEAASGIQSGAQAIAGGAAAIANGAETAASQLPAVSAGVEQIEAGLQSISDDYLVNASAADGAALQYLQALAATGLSEEQQALLSQAMGYVSASKQIDDGVAATLDIETQKQDMSQAGELVIGLETIKAGADTLAQGLKSNDPANPGIYEAACQIKAGAVSGNADNPGIYEAASLIMGGVDTMVSDEKLGALIAGLDTMDKSGAALISGVTELKSGASALCAGTRSAVDGAATLKAGSSQLKEGASELALGAASLSQGAAELNTGAATLGEGISALLEGAVKLSDGTGTALSGAAALKDGTSDLLSGIQELKAGSVKLLEGAGELKDGMSEFKEQGIERLAELVKSDAAGIVDRIKALKDFSEEYTSFSGSNGEDTGVKFIIRTDSIGE